MKKFVKILIASILFITLAYFLGPKSEFGKVSSEIKSMDISITALDSTIAASEGQFTNIKPENESRIIWADSVRKTPYSMVYLHGFSAGVMESNPVHKILAKKYGCNLYLARLSHHGLSGDDAFEGITPVSLMNSAKEAVAIGQLIGEQVILVSCSTGGTMSIFLTAHNPELVAAQILYSPNTAIDDPSAQLLNKPWGKQILNAVIGPYRPANPKWIGTPVEKYWSLTYKSDALIALQELLDQTMTDEVFSKINTPYFIGYYYKNEEESDHVISVPGLLHFTSQTQTPNEKKRVLAFPNVGSHVMASDLQSKDIQSVIEETSAYLEEVLHLQPMLYDSLNSN